MPIPRLAFLALLDSLEEQQRIALFDAKSAPEDVADALTRVAAKRDWSSISSQDDDVAVDALLRAAAVRLAPAQCHFATRAIRMRVWKVPTSS